MTFTVAQSATAVAARSPASFLGSGGMEPYLYEVLPGGAGGTIDPTTGMYTAPLTASSDPALAYDTIRVTDYADVTATAQILVGSPLLLFTEIIQQEMGLEQNRVILWDQKLFQPRDTGLWVSVSVPSCKPFANVKSHAANGDDLESNQYVCMQATVVVDITSRGPAARDRKEEIVLAVMSDYAERQQTANSFYISKTPTPFINLSQLDGTAIPYRYQISFKMIYTVAKTQPVEFFDQFEEPTLDVDP